MAVDGERTRYDHILGGHFEVVIIPTAEGVAGRCRSRSHCHVRAVIVGRLGGQRCRVCRHRAFVFVSHLVLFRLPHRVEFAVAGALKADGYLGSRSILRLGCGLLGRPAQELIAGGHGERVIQHGVRAVERHCVAFLRLSGHRSVGRVVGIVGDCHLLLRLAPHGIERGVCFDNQLVARLMGRAGAVSLRVPTDKFVVAEFNGALTEYLCLNACVCFGICRRVFEISRAAVGVVAHIDLSRAGPVGIELYIRVDNRVEAERHINAVYLLIPAAEHRAFHRSGFGHIGFVNLFAVIYRNRL